MRVKPVLLLVAGVATMTWADNAPPEEFWLYLLEYGNAQGEVLDPLDLDDITQPAGADEPPADAPTAGQEETMP